MKSLTALILWWFWLVGFIAAAAFLIWVGVDMLIRSYEAEYAETHTQIVRQRAAFVFFFGGLGTATSGFMIFLKKSPFARSEKIE